MAKLMAVKRNGEVVDFDRNRIRNAILKAVKACGQTLPEALLDEIVLLICQEAEERFVDFFPNVENIQDLVEKNLVQKGLYEIAKEYILYRNKRQKERDEQKKQNIEKSLLGKLTIRKRDGRIALFDIKKVKACIFRASKGFENDVEADVIVKEVVKNIYDGVTTEEIDKALVLATIAFIECDSAYSFVGARLFLQRLYKEVMAKSITNDVFGMEYRSAFVNGIKKGVEKGLLDKRMLDFDLEKLSYGLAIERDDFFEYIGVQVLYERYFLKCDNTRFELPQAFWMRVAMGLAISEQNRNERALEFYEVMSKFLFVPSTPTLFHSGASHPQLSSCYLTTVMDDLKHIFKCIGDNAQLSKWSGGIANDWTNIRATGAYIKSTNVESQGVIPFLKIANDTTAAINRSGKRRGATCAYLETWHLDIEDFIDLRKNTGDERRRTHDMDTSNWIPDVFMKRVLNDEEWTLFSPEEVPELHHVYGKKFEKRYFEYEEKAKKGQMKKFKVVSAVKLWRKMLSMLFETGHPWITFKDPCNIRSPQDHCGVVHSSNLCTEITLNTSEDETAVCNLGSVNLGHHIVDGKLDKELLAKTVKTAVRMLDNVIDINFYPTVEAQNSNLKHRPVGLGIMGFQDALFKLDLRFESPATVDFSDKSMEFISYHAIIASSELAKERGTYQSYKGSKWDRNIFPIDTLSLLEEERGMKVNISREERMDWPLVRAHVKQFGMRNSNVMAVAPTATISNIVGCFPCIEPIYKNIYVKANMSGEFTVVNSYLVNDLKKLNLWNKELLDQIKYYDGNLQLIPLISQNLKDKYREAFEIEPLIAVDITAARSKWIDQSQSHNVFIQSVSGKKLSDVYIHAWKCGLKTTYYLRTLGASQIEKATLDASKFGFTQKREYKHVAEAVAVDTVQKLAEPVAAVGHVKACRIAEPDCEACQ
ncbi:ribonucleoside-diphosphate reductase subunit alpha [Candidatus Woesearchaeota archaeon]|nr:ribonucleoside-diphosphate reductase subunit alpha [Candidatus Woesearchaeota archaeon]